MNAFLTTLDVKYVDGNYWRLAHKLIYQVAEGDVIEIPRGFTTDYASVPPVIRWMFPKSGKYCPAAVVHDWLYFKKTRPRAEADGIFCEAMKILGVNAFTYQQMYWALRAFGWIAWKFGKDKYNQEFK